MKKRISVALMVTCLLVFSGCAKTARPEAVLHPIVNENGIYAFPGYEWGMEKADLERTLGCALDISYNTEFLIDDGREPVDGNNAMMMADKDNRWHTIEGTPFYAAYLFNEGKLISIEFGHGNGPNDKPNGIDFVNYPRLAEKLVAVMTAQIGEPDVKYDVEQSDERPEYLPASTMLHYLWNNEEADTLNWLCVDYKILNDVSKITITGTKAPK